MSPRRKINSGRTTTARALKACPLPARRPKPHARRQVRSDRTGPRALDKDIIASITATLHAMPKPVILAEARRILAARGISVSMSTLSKLAAVEKLEVPTGRREGQRDTSQRKQRESPHRAAILRLAQQYRAKGQEPHAATIAAKLGITRATVYNNLKTETDAATGPKEQ